MGGQHKKTFLKELDRLPTSVRRAVEGIAFEKIPNSENPFAPGLLEKMQGYDKHYKIRVRDYRIGVLVDSRSRRIEFMRVLHRREIYRYFP